MGIDKSLDDRFPTVEIKGQRWHYGKVPEDAWDCYGLKRNPGDIWMVEHPTNAKAYMWFKCEQEMQDFITALPESANPPVWNQDRSKDEWERLWDQFRDRLRAILADRGRTPYEADGTICGYIQ